MVRKVALASFEDRASVSIDARASRIRFRTGALTGRGCFERPPKEIDRFFIDGLM
jgi:hypothetical protein